MPAGHCLVKSLATERPNSLNCRLCGYLQDSAPFQQIDGTPSALLQSFPASIGRINIIPYLPLLMRSSNMHQTESSDYALYILHRISTENRNRHRHLSASRRCLPEIVFFIKRRVQELWQHHSLPLRFCFVSDLIVKNRHIASRASLIFSPVKPPVWSIRWQQAPLGILNGYDRERCFPLRLENWLGRRLSPPDRRTQPDAELSGIRAAGHPQHNYRHKTFFILTSILDHSANSVLIV